MPRHLFAAVGVSLSLTLSALAQQSPSKPATAPPAGSPAGAPTGAPPAGAPMDVPLPAGKTMPTEGWSDADKSAEAVKKAEEFLKATHAAYAAAPGLTDNVTVELLLGQQRSAQKINLVLGKKWDMRLTGDVGFEITAVDDQLYMILPGDKSVYLTAPIVESPSKTAGTLLPEFSLSVPSLVLRHNDPDANYTNTVFGLGSNALENIKVVGSRLKDGKMQMLLTSAKGGEAMVEADPATHIVSRAFYVLPADPDGATPPLPLEMTFDTKFLSEAPAIAFDKKDKTAFTSALDMLQAVQEKSRAGGRGAAPGGASAPGGGGDGNAVAIGAVAPLATVATMEGETFDLASLKGKVIVLDLWATWCGPCKRGLPLLQQFADEMKSNPKVAVFAVNSVEQPQAPGIEVSDEMKAAVRKKVTDFWKQGKYTFPTLIDYSAQLMTAYGATGIPFTIIIDTQGKLSAVHMGFSPDMVNLLRADVTKALGGAAGESGKGTATDAGAGSDKQGGK